MKNHLYTVYNTLSARYGDVSAYPSDSFAIRRVQTVLTQQGFSLDEFELCRVGTIGIENGVIEPCAPVRLTWEQKVDNSSN